MTLTFEQTLVECKHIYSFDLDLNPMTLVLKVDLDIIKMYVCTENEVPSLSVLDVTAWTETDKQTDSTEIIT